MNLNVKLLAAALVARAVSMSEEGHVDFVILPRIHESGRVGVDSQLDEAITVLFDTLGQPHLLTEEDWLDACWIASVSLDMIAPRGKNNWGTECWLWQGNKEA